MNTVWSFRVRNLPPSSYRRQVEHVRLVITREPSWSDLYDWSTLYTSKPDLLFLLTPTLKNSFPSVCHTVLFFRPLLDIRSCCELPTLNSVSLVAPETTNPLGFSLRVCFSHQSVTSRDLNPPSLQKNRSTPGPSISVHGNEYKQIKKKNTKLWD